jgi:competence protein ComEC
VSRRPLVPLALALALGAALPPVEPRWAPGAGLLVLALPAPAPRAAAAIVAFAFLGWTARSVAAPVGAARPEEREIVEGLVTSVPERFDDRVRFTLREEGGRVLLAWAASPPWPLALGDRIRFPARLRAPEGARNPGGRDPARALAARGIALEASALAPPVRVAAPSPLARLEAARRRFAVLADGALPPREAALVRAIGAGDRDGIDPATDEAFARSGLAHLLSVSGLHLAVVAFAVDRLLRALLLRVGPLAARLEPRRIAAALAIPATALYAVATGASVPALRAAVAAGAAFAATLAGREREPLNVIALAALAILACEPGALHDVSFQLSFASVAGLAAWTRPLRALLPVAVPPAERPAPWPRAREVLLVGLCASAAATLATAPLVALHFRRVPLAGLLSNVPGVPLGSALTVAATAAALASAAWEPLARALLWACRAPAAALLALNDLAAAPRWAAPPVAAPGPSGAAAYYALALLALAGGRRRALRIACALAAAAALLAPGPARRAAALARGGLEVTFVAVGQGDAAVLRLPDGSAVLVDGGGDPRGRVDPGARDVLPWLLDSGAREVAAAFLSHPHPDHLAGLPAVHAALPFARLFTSGRNGGAQAAAALAALPPATPFPPGARWERAGVVFEALGPPAGSATWSENDASLVLRVRHGATTFLFPGDVEAEGEAALAAAGAPLAADVVKVPHHGSATSSGAALVAATRPSVAVICLGRENRFGFPAPAVVARWEAAGARVLRTDRGAVRLLSNGRTVRVAPAAAAADALALLRERP